MIKNGSYQALDDFGRHFNLPRLPGTQLPQLDFCGLAQSQGVHGVRVERPQDLDRVLRAAFDAPAKPTLVEVVVERVAETRRDEP